jgi:hypothetical protein
VDISLSDTYSTPKELSTNVPLSSSYNRLTSLTLCKNSFGIFRYFSCNIQSQRIEKKKVKKGKHGKGTKKIFVSVFARSSHDTNERKKELKIKKSAVKAYGNSP